ncbi:hypothetical protein AQI84_22590 [Streptomyces griseorubiginosus]|nr:hypothetical protein AQI84_22590 [Streptomyces griseorubiginosus]
MSEQQSTVLQAVAQEDPRLVAPAWLVAELLGAVASEGALALLAARSVEQLAPAQLGAAWSAVPPQVLAPAVWQAEPAQAVLVARVPPRARLGGSEARLEVA